MEPTDIQPLSPQNDSLGVTKTPDPSTRLNGSNASSSSTGSTGTTTIDKSPSGATSNLKKTSTGVKNTISNFFSRKTSSTEQSKPSTTSSKSKSSKSQKSSIVAESGATVTIPQIVVEEERNNSLTDGTEGRVVGDLVLYGEDGKPYIDVNRLIYNPRKRDRKEVKERFSWYFADHSFIISNFISLICSAYVLAVAIGMIFWEPSINSVTSYATLNKRGLIYSGTVFGRQLDPRKLGFALLGTAIINGINVLLGTLACIHGVKILLFQHVFIDTSIFAVQLAIGIAVTLSGTCDSEEILGFQEGMNKFIAIYSSSDDSLSTDPEDEKIYVQMQLNDIQLSMQCCGSSNWTDYINPEIVSIPPNDNRIFPSSCCRAWWMRNVHCAEGVHMWAAPFAGELNAKKFRQRIHQIGCTSRVWLACKKLIFMSGQGLIVNGIFNFLLLSLETFSVGLQIRSLDTILREMKALEDPKTGGRTHKHDQIQEDEEEEVKSSKSKLQLSTGMKAIQDLNLALPTEDEIQFIKSRTAFSKFEVQVKRTNLGKMMKTARDTVNQRYDNEEEELVEQLGVAEDKHHRHILKKVKSASLIGQDENGIGKRWHSIAAMAYHSKNKEKAKPEVQIHPADPDKARVDAERKDLKTHKRRKKKKLHRPAPKIIVEKTYDPFANLHKIKPQVPSHKLRGKNKKKKGQQPEGDDDSDDENQEDQEIKKAKVVVVPPAKKRKKEPTKRKKSEEPEFHSKYLTYTY